MAKVMGERPSILALISELVSRGMPQHMRMHRDDSMVLVSDGGGQREPSPAFLCGSRQLESADRRWQCLRLLCAAIDPTVIIYGESFLAERGRKGSSEAATGPKVF